MLIGNTPKLFFSFSFTLGHEFDIKNLGALYYFLGLKFSSFSSALHLSQTKYTQDILCHNNLLECKPCGPLLSANA